MQLGHFVTSILLNANEHIAPPGEQGGAPSIMRR